MPLLTGHNSVWILLSAGGVMIEVIVAKYGFDRVEEIIKERIENGWDYCGYVPIETRGTGDIETMSLIFQKNE